MKVDNRHPSSKRRRRMVLLALTATVTATTTTNAFVPNNILDSSPTTGRRIVSRSSPLSYRDSSSSSSASSSQPQFFPIHGNENGGTDDYVTKGYGVNGSRNGFPVNGDSHNNNKNDFNGCLPKTGFVRNGLHRLRNIVRTGHGNITMLKQNIFAAGAGLCLAFNSGYINGCCLSGVLRACGTGVPTAAFTGAYTNAGLAIGAGNYHIAISNFQMIISFMIGAALSGFLNPRPKAKRITPIYGPSFLLGSALLAASSTLAYFRPEGRSFLYLAACANGLQNAISSAYSANLIRSSHMSGITSDIGMIFGQMVGGNLENAWRFVILNGLATSFLCGGIVSFWAVHKYKHAALAVNALLFATIAIATVMFTMYQQKVSLWRAATGNWEYVNNQKPTIEKMSELFERYDQDGNGLIDEDEFQLIMNDFGVMGLSDIGSTAIFRSIDTDQDGTISVDELFGVVMCDAFGEECEIIFDLPTENTKPSGGEEEDDNNEE